MRIRFQNTTQCINSIFSLIDNLEKSSARLLLLLLKVKRKKKTYSTPGHQSLCSRKRLQQASWLSLRRTVSLSFSCGIPLGLSSRRSRVQTLAAPPSRGLDNFILKETSESFQTYQTDKPEVMSPHVLELLYSGDSVEIVLG